MRTLNKAGICRIDNNYNKNKGSLDVSKINTNRTLRVLYLHCALGYRRERYSFACEHIPPNNPPLWDLFPFTHWSREFKLSLKYGSHMINVGHVTSMRNSCHSGPMLLERFLYILCVDLWPGVVVERFGGWNWKKKQYMGDVFEFSVSYRGNYVVILSFGAVGWSPVLLQINARGRRHL